MISSLEEFRNPFLMGIAGSGMTAIAQWLAGSGKHVSGSDRFFNNNESNEIRDKLEIEGIRCYAQNGEGIKEDTDLVVISTAVEETVPELIKAREMNIPVIRRAELLALIASCQKTIAIGGTSGKSTTTAMLFEILDHAGLKPGIISGAGLISLIKEGKIGNTKVGEGEWLVIEADESDGSIVLYKPEIGVLLNIDKDHKEINALLEMFGVFRDHSRQFIVNQSHVLARKFSKEIQSDFSADPASRAGYMATDFKQEGLNSSFRINGVEFRLSHPGKHNMENALAATAVANQLGVPIADCAAVLEKYEGIYRRHQVLGKKKGIWVIDDYAHNPVKCAVAIAACQPLAPKVIAWFQPHGYGPTRFLRHDFVKEIASVLRPEDEIWMSEIFYAGGTTTKDISSADLINDIKALGKSAFFIENRKDFLFSVRPHLTPDCVVILMGARDPSLEQFAKQVWEGL